jgi:hypothetical protein
LIYLLKEPYREKNIVLKSKKMSVLTVSDKNILREILEGKHGSMEFRWEIAAFITGIEQGSNGLSGITQTISKHLRVIHQIEASGNETWEDQLERLAEQRKRTWENLFAVVVRELL